MDTEPTLRENTPPMRTLICEAAVYELARIMAGFLDTEPSDTGRVALVRSGLAEQTHVSGSIVITDAGQAVWKYILSRIEEEL